VISTEQTLSTYQIITSHRYQAAADERIAVLICGGNATAVNFDS
jgi:hypothetical protein